MRLTPDTRAYQFVGPFTFAGDLMPAESWVVIYLDEHQVLQRFALTDTEFRDYSTDLLSTP